LAQAGRLPKLMMMARCHCKRFANWCLELAKVNDRACNVAAEAKGAGYLRTGDTVIAIQGWRDGVGHTNTIRILVVS
jgi:hypothetical protein